MNKILCCEKQAATTGLSSIDRAKKAAVEIQMPTRPLFSWLAKYKSCTIAAMSALLTLTSTLIGYEFTHTINKIDPATQAITLTFKLPAGEYLYKDSLRVTVNNQHVKLSPLIASAQPTTFLDETATVKKEGYSGTVSFTTTAKADSSTVHNGIVLNAHFLVSTIHKAQEKNIPLVFQERASEPVTPVTPSAPAITPASEQQRTVKSEAPCAPQQPSLVGSFIQKIISFIKDTLTHAKNGLISLFTSTGSRVLRLGAALLLGIMLSLTPCIYPMIPITVGLLQASGSSSTWRNFLLALCYTLGISTTFALFGLIAALGSCVFGELQGSPFLIIPIAALLIYFGLCMFDVVNMYIPRWLQPKPNSVKGGSLISAYAFGALSGTVASPCLSPGLVLILNYVTKISANQLAQYLEGFGLLFIFGVGSSLPLLIIGTFSASLHVLPKAGAWMNEIKKLVGIMLFSMAFYHLSHLESLLPWYLLVWIVVASFFAMGCYYFISIDSHDRRWMRYYKNGMGVLLIIISSMLAVEGVKSAYDHLHPLQKHSAWLHEYDAAVALSRSSNKPLFIDIGATYCSACAMLDRTIFSQERIEKALQAYVQLKIDSDVHKDAYAKILTHYKELIKGFPTYIVVNSKGEVLKTWSVEIDELSIDALVDELQKYA